MFFALSRRFHSKNLPQTSSFTLPFQQTQNISLSDGSLDISDDGTSGSGAGIGVHEFDTNLGDVTRVSGTAEDTVYFGEFDWLILKKLEA
jgi:hypothetical protein